MAESGIAFTPEFFSFNSLIEVESFIGSHYSDEVIVCDEIKLQLKELLKCRNPEKRLSNEQLEEMVLQHLNGKEPVSYGTWVYYPWNKHLVHVLPKEEFIEVRTNRNQYKITPEEQQVLNRKRVGVIGLSVGQSVALTMAMERSFGELRLADFDTLDLSNLNRLRASVAQIGLSKTQICAREILELDPYLRVVLFEEGIHENNIDEFMSANGKLDLLIEECDGLDVKILSRYKAREYGIPVLMETSDRGLLDIERFDIDPKRPLLHGLIGDLDPAKLKGLSMEDKIEYLLPMVGLNALSERMKASMIEVQSSISSWPQLASSVTMGGGVAAEMSRKIMLNQSSVSGRYYVDLDEIVPEPQKEQESGNEYEVKASMEEKEALEILHKISFIQVPEVLSNSDKQSILEAAAAAPSGGNTQPWKFAFSKGHLLLFHDKYYSQSFLDYANLGSYLAFGAMIENIRIAAACRGFKIKYRYFPDTLEPRLVAVCSFEAEPTLNNNENRQNLEALYKRMTNRKIGIRKPLDEEIRKSLQTLAHEHKPVKLTLVEDHSEMMTLAEVLSTAEMLLLLHPQGHQDMFHKELRFTEKEVQETRDGVDIATLNMNKAEILALKIASSRKAIEWVERIGGGEAFKKNTKKAISASSALGIISMPFYSNEAYCSAGELVQKLWIETTKAGYSFQPVTQFSYLLARLLHGEGQGYSDSYRKKFQKLHDSFKSQFPDLANREINFIFRIAAEKDMEVRALRRNVDQLMLRLS